MSHHEIDWQESVARQATAAIQAQGTGAFGINRPDAVEWHLGGP
jgi:hypothetical protein